MIAKQGSRFAGGQRLGFALSGRLKWVAVVGLLLQLVWSMGQPRLSAHAQQLPVVPDAAILRVLSFGEPETLSKVLMLWLQAYDYQSGVSLSFADLDRERLEGWLTRILELDPRSPYPLLAAIRWYGEIPVEANQRAFCEFVYGQFFVDPNHRWPWLAHAALLAKHRLKDLPLALKYARAMSQYATGSQVPAWVRQMEFVILEQMGELESARVLIGGLLASGQVTDGHEIHFLTERLRSLEARSQP